VSERRDPYEVLVLDTVGELGRIYGLGHVAFVGGSFAPIGGHNLLEPAALGLPLLSGPYVFNAQEIADMFIARHACTIVNDSTELAAAVALLLSDPAAAARMGDAGRDILERNRGALARLMAMIEPLVD
jgi:3-deoxy-D-manno-octulosonic-acid transferase